MLDDRLVEIIGELAYMDVGDDDFIGTEDYLKRLKQAFADEGYFPASVHVHNLQGKQLMTGQEWYDRLQAEIEKINLTTNFTEEINDYTGLGLKSYEVAIVYCVTKLDRAARKASGLK